MASDIAVSHPAKPSMTVAQLVAFTKKELDADAERQGKVAAAGPKELQQSQTGSTLDLSHKNLHALPVEVIALIKDKVERLALSHNPQIAVPSQIVQCDRLRYLNLRGNQLVTFPEAVLQLSSLEILDISKNRIVSIPEGIKNMTSLKFLAVARNKITRLPLALGEMSSLSKLKFDENPIEYPPPDALKPSPDRMANESEKEKDVCLRVKRFLKAAALREKLRTKSEEDLSESSVETPRPPKRTVTVGRFPVRPSVSGVDNVDDLAAKSPNAGPPPIPQRSHARNLSTNAPPAMRRPGIAPLLTGAHNMNRSRSESVASSASLRSRRQGFVPSKTKLDPDAVSEVGGTASARSSQASTIRASHSRANSSISTMNGFLTASSGETSSGAVSPIDGPVGRYGAVRRLSSLPESRNSGVQPSSTISAAKRLLFSLAQLHGPVGEIARAIKDGTPKRSNIERLLFGANAQVEELDRQLHRLESNLEDDVKSEEQALKPIVLTSVAALKSYSSVIKELKQHTQKMVANADPVYVRCLMSQIYMTMVESRNICSMMGFAIKTPTQKKAARVSQAYSSRTVTPTQSRPVNNRRLRGATILQSMSSSGELRSMPPPAPLNINGSRTNTMTSMSTVTPRSGESFSTSSSTVVSRSNTLRNVVDRVVIRNVLDDGDSEEHFSGIYLKLKSTTEQASQSLSHCRAEFVSRRDNAKAMGQARAVQHWALAIDRCEKLINANNALGIRLASVKVKDPGVRTQTDFWQLCDRYVKAWTDLASTVKGIAEQRVDTSTIKTVMRPLHRAFKEVTKMIAESPLYQQAIRGAPTPTSATTPFPTSMNAAFAQAVGQQQMNGLRSGYVTPVPATPLSAALGPAVQATVASTPGALQSAPEYFHVAPPVHGSRTGIELERANTIHGRR